MLRIIFEAIVATILASFIVGGVMLATGGLDWLVV